MLWIFVLKVRKYCGLSCWTLARAAWPATSGVIGMIVVHAPQTCWSPRYSAGQARPTRARESVVRHPDYTTSSRKLPRAEAFIRDLLNIYALPRIQHFHNFLKTLQSGYDVFYDFCSPDIRIGEVVKVGEALVSLFQKHN